MRNILRKLPGAASRSRSKSKSRKADDKEKDDNNEKLKTKEEHLRVPKIQACDLKVQKDFLCNENLQWLSDSEEWTFPDLTLWLVKCSQKYLSCHIFQL